MVMNFALYDTNLHMLHHYKRINSAKKVVNTSAPKTQKRKCVSSLNSRYSTPTLLSCPNKDAARANSHCEVRKNRKNCLKNEQTPSERSGSVPPSRLDHSLSKIHENIQRNNSTSKKNVENYSPSNCSGSLTSSPKHVKEKSESSFRKDIAKRPIPTPRSFVSDHKATCLEDYEYLQFSLRITEDIIRNDLYSQKEMRQVFNSHIEANRGRLNMRRMLQQIDHLCKELDLSKKAMDKVCKCTGTIGIHPIENKCCEFQTKKELLMQQIYSGHVINDEEICNVSEDDLQQILNTILNNCQCDDVHYNKDVIKAEQISFASEDQIEELSAKHVPAHSSESILCVTNLQNIQSDENDDMLQEIETSCNNTQETVQLASTSSKKILQQSEIFNDKITFSMNKSCEADFGQSESSKEQIIPEKETEPEVEGNVKEHLQGKRQLKEREIVQMTSTGLESTNKETFRQTENNEKDSDQMKLKSVESKINIVNDITQYVPQLIKMLKNSTSSIETNIENEKLKDHLQENSLENMSTLIKQLRQQEIEEITQSTSRMSATGLGNTSREKFQATESNEKDSDQMKSKAVEDKINMIDYITQYVLQLIEKLKNTSRKTETNLENETFQEQLEENSLGNMSTLIKQQEIEQVTQSTTKMSTTALEHKNKEKLQRTESNEKEFIIEEKDCDQMKSKSVEYKINIDNDITQSVPQLIEIFKNTRSRSETNLENQENSLENMSTFIKQLKQQEIEQITQSTCRMSSTGLGNTNTEKFQQLEKDSDQMKSKSVENKINIDIMQHVPQLIEKLKNSSSSETNLNQLEENSLENMSTFIKQLKQQEFEQIKQSTPKMSATGLANTNQEKFQATESNGKELILEEKDSDQMKSKSVENKININNNKTVKQLADTNLEQLKYEKHNSSVFSINKYEVNESKNGSDTSRNELISSITKLILDKTFSKINSREPVKRNDFVSTIQKAVTDQTNNLYECYAPEKNTDMVENNGLIESLDKYQILSDYPNKIEIKRRKSSSSSLQSSDLSSSKRIVEKSAKVIYKEQSAIVQYLEKYEQSREGPRGVFNPCLCECEVVKPYSAKLYDNYVPKFSRSRFFPTVSTQTSNTDITNYRGFSSNLLSDGEVECSSDNSSCS